MRSSPLSARGVGDSGCRQRGIRSLGARRVGGCGRDRVRGKISDPIAARLADATLLAPHLLPTEVDIALRCLERGGRISTAQVDASRGPFAQFPIDLWPWHLLADWAWQLLVNATTYDAGYLALAELTNAMLVTCDAWLHSMPRSSARVEVPF